MEEEMNKRAYVHPRVSFPSRQRVVVLQTRV